jgi:hypothetical protein
MALSFFKSATEAPWDQFSRAMGQALAAASEEFSRQHDRQIALGSPVKIAEPGADIIRVPIEVRGGTPQYAIAYLHAKDTDIRGRLDHERIRRIAGEAVAAAAPYATTPPRVPGETVLTYP